MDAACQENEWLTVQQRIFCFCGKIINISTCSLQVIITTTKNYAVHSHIKFYSEDSLYHHNNE